MAGLFSDEDKVEVNQMFFLLHETFQKNLVVYNESKKVVTRDKEKSQRFNAIYNNNRSRGQGKKIGHTKKNEDKDKDNSVSYELNATTIQARISYDRRLDLESMGEANAQLKIAQSDAEVKITVLETDFEIVKNAKRFEYNGIKYYRVSEFRPQGFFNTIFYSFYCSATEAI